MNVDVITPWYPDPASVFLGIFVEQQVDAVRRAGLQVSVEVAQIFPAPPGPTPAPISDAVRRQAERDVNSVYPTRDGATWVPCPVPARSGFSGRTAAFAAGLTAKRRILPAHGDVVHAHLAVPTAAAALELGDAPLVVTEHQSTLDLVLDEPPARELYREVIERAGSFFVVSGHLRSRLIDTFGAEVSDQIRIMPNIVDLDGIPFHQRDHRQLDRWIYVGSIAAHKGARLLIEAFIHYRRHHNPAASLTLVGDGPETGWARDRLAEADATRAVNFRGAVPRSAIGDLLEDADLMVHLSPAETFGIASLEGLGAGLPVISLRNGGADHTWGDFEAIAGRILEPGASAANVSDAVAELGADSTRLDLGACRARIEVTYGADAVATKLVDAYRDACT